MTGLAAARWRTQVAHYLPLIARVLDQSGGAVLVISFDGGESPPSDDATLPQSAA
jgi:hypothetical protein